MTGVRMCKHPRRGYPATVRCTAPNERNVGEEKEDIVAGWKSLYEWFVASYDGGKVDGGARVEGMY